MKYYELANLVRNLVSDASSLSNTWDDTQIADSINYACKEYAKKTRSTRYHYDSNISYEGEFPSPHDYLELVHIQYLGKELVKTNHDFESVKSQTWETDTAAAPKRWLYFGGHTVKLVPGVAGWTPTNATDCVTGSNYVIRTIGSTTWSTLGATGNVTGGSFLCTTGGTTGSGNGTAFSLTYWPSCAIEYVQRPTPCSTSDAVFIGSLVTGSTYTITGSGASGFTVVGADDDLNGTVFVATGLNGATGATGYAYETIDERIPLEHHIYLQYAAASYLIRMFGDRQSIELADKYLSDFNQLIGPIALF